MALLPGWRLTPNDHFYRSAAEAGFPVEGSSPGGPSFIGTFAYSALANLEVAIDLFGSAEQLHLQGRSAFTSISYGALLGARLQWSGFIAEELTSYVGLFTGPVLIYVTGGDLPQPEEHLATGYAGAVGLTYRLSESFGLTLEYRLLLARGQVTDLGSLNGGGQMLSVGMSFFVPGEGPSRNELR